MEDGTRAIFAIVGMVILICGILFCVLYRKEAQIVVEDRWWTYYKAYKYDVETTYVEVVTETHVDSNGNAHTTTSTQLRTRTDTYIRCQNTSSGRQLPVQEPRMSCVMEPGDYKSESIAFHISYHESEQKDSKPATIPGNAWASFEPKKVINVKITLFQHITDFEVLNKLWMIASD